MGTSKASSCSQNEFQAGWGAAPEKQWNAVENETPYKSHSRTSLSQWEFDSVSPQGGRVEIGTFQSCGQLPSATGNIFICPSCILFCCVYNDVKNPGTTPWFVTLSPLNDFSLFRLQLFQLTSACFEQQMKHLCKCRIVLSLSGGFISSMSLFMELPGEGNSGRILVLTGSIIHHGPALSEIDGSLFSTYGFLC